MTYLEVNDDFDDYCGRCGSLLQGPINIVMPYGQICDDCGHPLLVGDDALPNIEDDEDMLNRLFEPRSLAFVVGKLAKRVTELEKKLAHVRGEADEIYKSPDDEND